MLKNEKLERCLRAAFEWLAIVLVSVGLLDTCGSAHADLPSAASLNHLTPTQYGYMHTKWADGNDQTQLADAADPTIPLALTGVDNQDGTGLLTWEESSDPNVAGIVTGVASYKVKLGGTTTATVTAPYANIQPELTQYRIGAADNESSSQSGADWTMTFGGGGLLSTADHLLMRGAAVTGDFVATIKVSSFMPTSGTTGSVGIAARASNSAVGSIAAYARWRDSDDKCNMRYRGATNGSAGNGAFSSITYSAPFMVRMIRAGDLFTTQCSSDGGATWATTSSATIAMGLTVYVGPFITSGTANTITATGTAAQFSLHQGRTLTYAYTGVGGTFTVTADDGTNESDASASVVLQPTGGGVTGTAPSKFVVSRASSTSATLEWKAPENGPVPSVYRAFMASTEEGQYSQVWQGTPVPANSNNVYSYTHTGISSGAEPWFKVAAVVNGVEQEQSVARKVSVGAVLRYMDTYNSWLASVIAPNANPPMQTSATSTDTFSFDDNVASPESNGGDLGMRLQKYRLFGGNWAMRAQLTWHDYGSNSPSDGVASQQYYPATVKWRVRGDASANNDCTTCDTAHRNEYAFIGGTEITDLDVGEEHWLGFAVFLPGEGDAFGDAPHRAISSIPGGWGDGPQLHPTNIPDDPSTPTINEARSFSPELTLGHGTGGYAGFSGTNPYRTQHPTGAAVVRYQRGGDEPLGDVSAGTIAATVSHTIGKTTDGKTLYFEWDAVSPAPTTYKVEAAWRPEGPWAEVTDGAHNSDNITVSIANRRVIVTGLASSTDMSSGTNTSTRYVRVTPLFGATPGATSLIAPAPHWHWTFGANFSIDARPDYGRWVRWVVRYKRSATATGLLEVWKDDVKVGSEINTQQGSNTDMPAYWKIGIYAMHPGLGGSLTLPRVGMDWPWREVIYYDELRALRRDGGSSAATDTSDSAYQWVRPRGPAGE